jgi:UDP-N-acetylglucosamine diphosphorylase/glucosamine-1-phosphate N-acetyltransferase
VRLAAALSEAAGEGFGPQPDGDVAALLAAANLKADDADVTWPRTLVDLIGRNAESLLADLPAYDGVLRPPDPSAFPGVHLLRPDRIRLAEGVRLDPGSVLDASAGPVLLGPSCHVMAGCVVTGPVAAGAECRFKPLTRLEACSLGPVVRLGGEVEGSVIVGWSNKQHDGFLGHSYMGAWVNLGAATDTSDLKNDYGPVRITLAGETLDSGERHVGSLIGDHTKTAIHTRLNTGSVIGVACNLLGADFSPKAVPSFCWGGDGRWSEYRLDKAVAVARVVATRRARILGEAEARLLERVHDATATLRARFLRG